MASSKQKAKLTVEKDSQSVTYASGRDTSTPPDLRILHYNDVYHLDPSSAEPVGGAARFLTLVEEYRSHERYQGQPELLPFFSGDVFNPSLESSITKGSHMTPILNAIGTACSCIGNHDLDFGERQFRYLSQKCKFPWLLANVLDPDQGEDVPIGKAKQTHMITTANGIKVGLIGLGEREWLETVNALPPNLIYKSATETAKRLVPKLRAEGADIIIALTHMREPNDNKLAENMGGDIDLILGGHDHFYNHSLINGTHVLRSGSDFKQLSYIEARRRPGGGGKWDVDIVRRDAISAIPPHPPTVEMIDGLTAKLKQSLEKIVGYTAAPLDARFSTVRMRESNLGNFICDIMRHHYQADCAIMAAGTIRGDQIYPPGPIRVKDITDCFPFEDPVVVIKVTGRDLWDALESGVMMYPAQEGRFPQVSNIKFSFDPAKEPGSRIIFASVGGNAIDMEKKYELCTRGYMARGKDGYKSLLIESEGGKAEEIVSEENGILISMMLRQYFMSLKVLDRWVNWGPSLSRHWDQVKTNVTKYHPVLPPSPLDQAAENGGGGGGEFPIPRLPAPKTDRDGVASKWETWTAQKLRARRASVGPFDEHVIDGASPTPDQEALERLDGELRVMRRFFARWCRKAGVQAGVCDEIHNLDVKWTQAIAPRIEGRIAILSPPKEA